MNIKNISEGRRFLRLGIIGGVVLLSGLLVSLFISGKIALPVLIVEEADQGGGGQFLKVGDGELQIGAHTIRVSRHRLDMGNLPIHNLQSPAASSDAATKGYVDAQGGGYKHCYFLSGSSGACASGYDTLVSTDGTGCAVTSGWDRGLVLGEAYRASVSGLSYHCQGGSAGSDVQYECLWLLTSDGGWVLLAEVRCRHYPDWYASVVGLCCR